MEHRRSLSRSHPNLISKQRRRSRRQLWKLLISISPLLLSFIWISYREVENMWLRPQVIFILGGEEERELFGAQFAKQHPELPVWISGGAPKGYVNRVFKKAGISSTHVHLDYQAIDTLTNFTTLVDRFESQGITSVYLVTSDNHIQRARVIGELVFGSRGIKVKPVTFTSNKPPEPIQKTVRDGLRSVLWVATGYSGTIGSKNQ
jgi:uncharacterized SAM-binding protein YcdF (DUF218 family)